MNHEGVLSYYNWVYNGACACGGMNGRVYININLPGYEVRVFPDNDIFRILDDTGAPMADDRVLSDLQRTLKVNNLY